MKKTKKLALSPETLRRLDDRAATQIAGGVSLTLAPACESGRLVCGGDSARANMC